MTDIAAAWRAFAAQPFGYLITCLFVGASTAIGVMFAVKLGAAVNAGLAVVLVVIALAAELFKSAYISMTFKRGRWMAAAVGLPFFLVCMAYSINASYRFAQENLTGRDWKAQADFSEYFALQREIESIDRRLAPIEGARSVAVIEAEIAGMSLKQGVGDCAVINGPVSRQWCPIIAERRAELATAQTRDTLRAERAARQATLSAMPAPSTTGEESLGPVAALLAALGMAVTSWADMTAHIIMIIVEAGSFMAPAVALSGARREAPALRAIEPVQVTAAHDSDLIAGLLQHDEPQVREIARYIAERTESAPGCWTPSSDIYDDYEAWKKSQGGEPLSKVVFGRVIVNELRLPRERRSRNGRAQTRYANIVVRPYKPAGGTLLSFARKAAV